MSDFPWGAWLREQLALRGYPPPPDAPDAELWAAWERWAAASRALLADRGAEVTCPGCGFRGNAVRRVTELAYRCRACAAPLLDSWKGRVRQPGAWHCGHWRDGDGPCCGCGLPPGVSSAFRGLLDEFMAENDELMRRLAQGGPCPGGLPDLGDGGQ